MNIVRRCKITICRLMSLRLLLQCQRRRIADQAPAAIPSQCLAFPFHDQPVPGLRHCRYSPDSRHSPCYSSCWRSSVFPHVPNTMIRALENIENGIRGRIRKRVFVKSGRETAHFFQLTCSIGFHRLMCCLAKRQGKLANAVFLTSSPRLSDNVWVKKPKASVLSSAHLRQGQGMQGASTAPRLRWSLISSQDDTHTRLLLSILLRRLCETVKIY